MVFLPMVFSRRRRRSSPHVGNREAPNIECELALKQAVYPGPKRLYEYEAIILLATTKKLNFMDFIQGIVDRRQQEENQGPEEEEEEPRDRRRAKTPAYWRQTRTKG